MGAKPLEETFPGTLIVKLIPFLVYKQGLLDYELQLRLIFRLYHTCTSGGRFIALDFIELACSFSTQIGGDYFS